MTAKLRIACARPGYRRAGLTMPAAVNGWIEVTVVDVADLTPAQIAELALDPVLDVMIGGDFLGWRPIEPGELKSLDVIEARLEIERSRGDDDQPEPASEPIRRGEAIDEIAPGRLAGDVVPMGTPLKSVAHTGSGRRAPKGSPRKPTGGAGGAE